MDTNFETKTAIDLGALDNPESKGRLVTQDSVTITPNAGGFNDTIITAQPVKQRRDVGEFMRRMTVLAQRAGEEYRYQWQVKKKDGTKETVEGASIKLANDLAREYGNCMVDCRVVAQGQDWVFYARFIDLETGYCLTRPLAQRRNQGIGMKDNDRAADIVFQIGASKAIRNVILNALQTYSDIIYDEAKTALVTAIGKNIEQWKLRVVERAEQNKWNFSRIEQATGKKLKEWTARDVAQVVAQLKSVTDGMAHFDDLFPDPAATNQTSAADLNKEFIKDDKVVDVKPAGTEQGQPAGPDVRAELPLSARIDRAAETVKKADKKD